MGKLASNSRLRNFRTSVVPWYRKMRAPGSLTSNPVTESEAWAIRPNQGLVVRVLS